jgi:hypothetical protein
MINPSDKILADHEAKSHGKDWLLLRWRGWQEGCGSMPGRGLYNVVAGAYTIGSTVTMDTMLNAGYRVEVVL